MRPKNFLTPFAVSPAPVIIHFRRNRHIQKIRIAVGIIEIHGIVGIEGRTLVVLVIVISGFAGFLFQFVIKFKQLFLPPEAFRHFR